MNTRVPEGLRIPEGLKNNLFPQKKEKLEILNFYVQIYIFQNIFKNSNVLGEIWQGSVTHRQLLIRFKKSLI